MTFSLLKDGRIVLKDPEDGSFYFKILGRGNRRRGSRATEVPCNLAAGDNTRERATRLNECLEKKETDVGWVTGKVMEVGIQVVIGQT